jgi:hypothetical protein
VVLLIMARFHPASPDNDATHGEKEVFKRLRALDDSWFVLHSLHFVWPDGPRHRMGESDFILIHPHRGILVVEVKDAAYRIRGREWYRQPRGGAEQKDRSPFEQAESNRHKITNLLKDAGVRFVPIGHCVVFKAGRPSGNLGPDAPPAITLTLATLDDAASAINGVMTHWGQGTWRMQGDFDRALAVLSPESVIRPSLDYDIDVSMGELHRLTDDQARLTAEQLEVVRSTSQTASSLVLGSAGTGKTFVAFAYARQLAAAKHRVAVVGVPKQLRLLTRRRLVTSGITVGDPIDVLLGLYGLAAVEAAAGDLAWEKAYELATEQGPQLDALIIDEAQSLEADLIDGLRELVVSDGQTVLLADPYQRDSSGMWRPNGTYQPFWLTRNCRNTLPIAKLVARVAGALPPVDGAPGTLPSFQARDASDLGRVARSIATEIGLLGRHQGVALVRTAAAAERIAQLLRQLGVRAVVASRGIREDCFAVCTVDEFRGCEAHSVFYVADAVGAKVDRRTVDYLAISRACANLRVVGYNVEWDAYRYLFAPQEATA